MALYFLITLGATFLGGLFGIGGGIIIKPALDTLTDLPVGQLNFLSSMAVLSMTAVSLSRRRRQERVEKGISSFLALGSILGGGGGKFLFEEFLRRRPEASLRLIQSLLLSAILLLVLLYSLWGERLPKGRVQNRGAIVGIGLFLGALAAFLGIGGGPLNLAVFLSCFSMNPKEGALNSLFVIFFSQLAALVLLLVTCTLPAFEIPLLVTMVTGGILGGLAGSGVSRSLSPQRVGQIFRLGMALLFLFPYTGLCANYKEGPPKGALFPKRNLLFFILHGNGQTHQSAPPSDHEAENHHSNSGSRHLLPPIPGYYYLSILFSPP